MATNPFFASQQLGYIPSAPSSTTLALNAAATWLAFGFLAPPGSKTINTVRVFVSSVTGTLAATDLTCDVFSDSPGNPGASLSSTSNVGGTAPTGAGWITFQGLTQATTAGTQYWLVFKNANATPASNFATYGYLRNALPIAVAGNSASNASSGACICTTTNSGAAWSATNQGLGSVRIGFSDGSYYGLAASSVASGTDKAFGSNEVGVKFTTPPNGILNVAGIAYMATPSGTPTGKLRFRLYNNTTLLSTTDDLTAVAPGGPGRWTRAYFASTQTIQPGTVTRASFCDSAADSSSNCYITQNEVVVDSDANSLALVPFEGTLQKTTFNGTSWTDTNTSIIPFALILDSAGEFGAGSGGMIQSRVFTGF